VTEAAHEGERRGGAAVTGGGVVARGGCGGGIHEAVVAGGSVEVRDVLLGEDDGEPGMHGRDLVSGVVRAL
jgi:hypothetical protein